LLFAFLFAIAMALIAVFGDQGFLAYRSLTSQEHRLRREVLNLRQQQDDLRQRVLALREDPATIERLARERLGLVMTGDTIIQIPQGDSSGQPR
jgi:cell division protein FtsB